MEKQKKTRAKQREVDRLLIVSVIIWIVSCSLDEHDRFQEQVENGGLGGGG